MTTVPATPTARSLRSERWRLRAQGARTFARRFSKRGDGVFGLAILLFFTLMALFPQLFVGPLETVVTASGSTLEPPSAQHPECGDDPRRR